MTLQALLKAVLYKPARGSGFIVVTSAVFTFATVILYLYPPAFINFLDNKYYDTLTRSIPQSATESSRGPVVVDLDVKSLARYGQWPWPRYRLAILVEKLQQLGASSIGLDLLLVEPDRTSFAVIKKDIYRDLGFEVPLDRVPRDLMDHDKTLADTLARGPYVLGFKFIFTENKSVGQGCTIHPMSLAVIREGKEADEERFLFHAQDVVCSLGMFTTNVAFSGFVNVIPDQDGVLRRTPLLIKYRDKYYPSLALAAMAQALGVKQASLKVTPEGIESLRLDDVAVPLDSYGNLLIRYNGKGKTFDYISASDVLAGRVSRERIQGKVVFVGTSATGLADIHPTPLDPVYPGVEVHATVVDNLLKRNFFSRPNWVLGLELLLVIGAGIFSTVLFTLTGAIWSLALLGVGILGLWQFSIWMLYSKSLYLSPVMPLIALTSNYFLVTILKHWREERNVRARSKNLILTQELTIHCLASLAETRDGETGGHILRTQRYVETICRQLATHPKYGQMLDSETIGNIIKSSPLHDIGKVGVPDHILFKPGSLTAEEFEQMKKHTAYGRDAIQRAEKNFGSRANSDFLHLAKEIAYTHHEKWDGTGYPEKLKGEAIPLSGRIMALADVYDALVCHRVYKRSSSHEEATGLIIELKGAHFDPDVVNAYLEVQEEFKQILIDFADHDSHLNLVERNDATRP